MMWLKSICLTFSGMRNVLVLALIVATTANAQTAPNTIEWGAYGRTDSGDAFSPASQITRENVTSLVPAWTYHTGELDVKTRRPAKLEVTPLMGAGDTYITAT